VNLLTLVSILAQASDSVTDITTSQPQMPEINPAMMIIPMIIGLGMMCLLYAFLFWKVFTKAGRPGWASLIPIYNLYILCKIAGKSGWWVIWCMFLIPFIFVCIALAEKFGKGAGFGIGLAFLGIIFFPILGFGDARYQGAPPLPGAV
jgi:hypothetical protein